MDRPTASASSTYIGPLSTLLVIHGHSPHPCHCGLLDSQRVFLPLIFLFLHQLLSWATNPRRPARPQLWPLPCASNARTFNPSLLLTGKSLQLTSDSPCLRHCSQTSGNSPLPSLPRHISLLGICPLSTWPCLSCHHPSCFLLLNVHYLFDPSPTLEPACQSLTGALVSPCPPRVCLTPQFKPQTICTPYDLPPSAPKFHAPAPHLLTTHNPGV